MFYGGAATIGVPNDVTKIQAVISSAALNVAAGKIYVAVSTAVGGGGVPTDVTKVQAAIDIAATHSYNAIYTVPRDVNWYLTSFRYRSTGSVAANDVILSLITSLSKCIPTKTFANNSILLLIA